MKAIVEYTHALKKEPDIVLANENDKIKHVVRSQPKHEPKANFATHSK